MTRPTLHFVLAFLLLVAAGIFLRFEHREVLPYHLPMRSFPQEIGIWRGTDIPISKDVLTTLGSGDFLLRVYQDSNPSSSLDLFIAYFPSQRTGDTIHSPQNCLPGAGWTPIHADRIVLSVHGYPSFPANRYLIAKGDARQFVLYWYWAHDRGIASEYLAKFYLVADSIRMHRSDGAMIRITTPLFGGENLSSAEQRVLSFANAVIPMLNNYIPN